MSEDKKKISFERPISDIDLREYKNLEFLIVCFFFFLCLRS
jgi:hypothetical protein